MPKLLITTGGATMPHELIEELITVGRASDNIIQIDDPSVSGRHAQINLVGEQYHLQDLESTNGTKVNDRPITSVALRAGDRIRFGKITASFEAEKESHEQPLPVLAEVEAKPAEVSARPADFANASPFPGRKSRRDPIRTAMFAAAGLAILAFLGSMISLLQMQPPAP